MLWAGELLTLQSLKIHWETGGWVRRFLLDCPGKFTLLAPGTQGAHICIQGWLQRLVGGPRRKKEETPLLHNTDHCVWTGGLKDGRDVSPSASHHKSLEASEKEGRVPNLYYKHPAELQGMVRGIIDHYMLLEVDRFLTWGNKRGRMIEDICGISPCCNARNSVLQQHFTLWKHVLSWLICGQLVTSF